MTRPILPALALCAGLCIAAGDHVAAQSGIPDPMAVPSPMLAAPGAPMQGAARHAEPPVERDPDFGNLPVGPGIDEVYYSCTACHSAQTFAQQRLTDARWDYLWDWMIEEQGMIDYGPESREIILAYLTTHFSSER